MIPARKSEVAILKAVPWWYYSDAYRGTCCSHRVVIRYAGTPQCQVPAAHGNSLSNVPYIRTKPSVLQKVKEVVTATGGHAGPAKVYKEAVSGNTSADPRVCPRNIKQVSLCLDFGAHLLLSMKLLVTNYMLLYSSHFAYGWLD